MSLFQSVQQHKHPDILVGNVKVFNDESVVLLSLLLDVLEASFEDDQCFLVVQQTFLATSDFE